jgi:hypothetical protein
MIKMENMKTKEEIEQLAEEFLTFHQEGSKVYHIKIREAIAFAYNKCQEDMVDKPKQETLEEAAEKYINTKNPQWTPYHRKSFEDGAKWQQTNSDKKYTEEDVKWAVSMAIGKRDGGCGYTEIATTLEDKLLNKQD